MTRSFFAIVGAGFLLTGSFSVVAAQEADPQGGEAAEAPRLTPDERRAQWEARRGQAPEDRRARFQQWRQGRGGAGAVEEPSGPPPENYLEQLEFRSVLTLDGVTEFSLRNPWENRTFLVTEGEVRNGIEVVEFDAERNALTLRHEDDTRTLHLQASRVVAINESNNGEWSEERRAQWEARREEFRAFRDTWREAAQESPELREIEQQFRDLASEFRENRDRLRELEAGTPEHDRLRSEMREMREEFGLLTEYSLLHARNNPAFEGYDVDSMERMVRGVLRASAAGDGEGRAFGERRRGGPGRRGSEQQ